MKLVLFATIVLSLSCFAISCTKTNNITTTIHDSTTVIVRDTVVVTSPKNPIVGLWVGAYKTNTLPASDSFYYSFAIRPDHTVITSGGGGTQATSYAAGPWQLNGTAFTATITTMDQSSPRGIQSITASYDSTTGVLANGTWTFTQGQTGSGTFDLRRIQ